MRWLLAAFFLGGALLHFRSPDQVARLVPGWVPWPDAVVLLTGLWEGAGAVLLLVPATRRAGALMLAAYTVAVFPGNIKHWWEGIHLFAADRTGWYHPLRLALQPVILWWALFAGRVVDWPFRRR